MRILLLPFAAALLLAGPTPAQSRKPTQVSAPALAAFKKAFPSATAVKWERENDGYEAGFRQGKTEMSAVISAAGELAETETSLAPAALPPAVRQTLAARYKGVKVHEAAKIVSAKTGAVTYEAEVRENGKRRDLLFTADGREVTEQ